MRPIPRRSSISDAGRALLGVLIYATGFACSDVSEHQLRVTFPNSAIEADAVVLNVSIYDEECPGEGSQVAPLLSRSVRRSGLSLDGFDLQSGTYGLHAVGLDETCRPVARTCTEQRFPASGDFIDLTLESVLMGSSICSSTCIAGHCARGQLLLDAGDFHTCGVFDDRISCYGLDRHGQRGLLEGESRAFTDVTTGARHSCAIDTDGLVFCWGDNNAGQLGVQGLSSSTTPVQVMNADGTPLFARFLAAGDEHTCAGDKNRLVCWGLGETGQLGHGTLESRSTPTEVLLNDATSVVAGGHSTCALIPLSDSGTNDGPFDAYCWGANGYGQLGVGNTSPQPEPQRVALTDFTSIDIGPEHACGIVEDMDGERDLYCWGNHEDRRLGAGYSMPVLTPQAVPFTEATPSQVTVGGEFACLLSSSGQVYCWGGNDVGQLGRGSTDVSSSELAPVDSPASAALRVSAGRKHACLYAADRGLRVYCWGDDSNQQLNRESESDFSRSPVLSYEYGYP